MWTKGEQNCTIPYGDCNSLKRFTSAYLFLIVRQKSWEYLLMIFLQKYHQLSALISLFCTLISLGSIDVLSANQCAESFACILLQIVIVKFRIALYLFLARCEGIRIPESSKWEALESGIHCVESRESTDFGWNPESIIRDPESTGWDRESEGHLDSFK